MKIEPNLAIEMRQEVVLCEGTQVILLDGTKIPKEQLGGIRCGFVRFLKTLDPNKSFILGLVDIENAQAKVVFFTARQIARQNGIHMQGDVSPYSEQLALWEQYKQMQSFRSIKKETGHE
ncbi:MAG TPA: hypothetical protein PKY88_07860 [Anaerohalosphaeraceae bacterium]|nr:hypothetical protein [Anaerohalosphaeraceae bacterium]